MAYNPTIYQGAAVHYRPGRPAYSPRLEAVLTEQLGLNGTGRLLDVGCGPGILTIRLAQLFEHAVGLDPDAAMLAEGCRFAEKHAILNIRWVRALAEELPAAAPGPYRLIAPGRTHRFQDVLVHTRFDLPWDVYAPVFLICFETLKACCPATSRYPPQLRTCSATASRISRAKCVNSSLHGHPRASSGTGRATPQ